MATADLRNRFDHHAPDQAKAKLHDDVRRSCLNLAGWLEKNCPDTRERSLAITKLEEAMFWANASIARN